MLKISKPLGAQKIGEYYKFEHTAADQAYYTEGKQLVGEWHGRLAEHFGLVGSVKEEPYNRLATGQHPRTGEQLIKHRPAAEDSPAWLHTDRAWREYLDNTFSDALLRGQDCFRLVPENSSHAESRRAQNLRPKLPGSEQLGSPVSERTAALLEMHRIAAQTFQENLEAETGRQARDYLTCRNAGRATAREFGLGFSIGSGTQLVEKLEGFGPDLMEASGLFVRDRGGRFQDRFRARLMFPIQNRDGAVIAFGARELGDGPGPKYVNSPITELYQKSAVLYNLHRASPEAGKKGRVVLVEGYMDAIAAHSAGVHNVVATCGTALSEQQRDGIKRCASEVVLDLDGDEAGRTAAQKHAGALLEHGLNVRALDLPGDPAEFISEHGPKAYRDKIKGVGPLVEWLTARASQKYDITTVEGKVDALHCVIETLERITPENRKVIAAELAAYLRTPVVGEPQEQKPKKHVEHIAAWDWTLAPHKSYSVTALVGGDTGLIDDHKKAVRIALDAGEKYTQARLPDTAPITTANWCGALFLHDSARPVGDAPPNPHLHTHAVVFNMTEAGDKIRSVKAHEWYRIQSYVAAVYQAEMAYAARARGYELEHGRNYSTAIKGYTEEYLRAVSARTEEIEREKAEKGLVGAEADERINKRLRRAKQTWESAALRQEHRKQAEQYGNDPEKVVAAARERCSLVLSESLREPQADRAINFARARLIEANAVVDHYELMRDALRFGLGHLRLQDVERAFDRRMVQEQREFVQVGHYRANAPGARYTTAEMRKLELDTIALALKGKGSTEPIATDLTRDRFREEFKHRIVDGRKIKLSDPQLWMAWNVLTSRDQVMIVRGAAGVGKSTAMKPIGEIAAHRRGFRSAGYEVLGLAATGAAANNLAEIGIRAETLQSHLMLGVPLTAKKRLYILDEGSLVGTRQFHDFLHTVRSEDRVIVAYDPRQHQSVEAGRIVEELEQAGVATFRLEKIVRQQNAPELLDVIERFARGHMREGLQLLEEQNRIREVSDRKKRFQVIAQEYAASPENTLIVSPDNRSLAEINASVRAELQMRGLLKPDRYEAQILVGRRDVRTEDRKHAATYNVDDVVRFGKTVGPLGVASGDYGRVIARDAEANLVTLRFGSGREVTYDPRRAFGVEIFTAEKRSLAEGERVQLTRPWKDGKRTKVANRELGTIERLDRTGNAKVKLDNGRKVDWKLPAMPHIEYAYAMTSYSLQSKTCERTLLQIDTGDSRIRLLLDKALLYVGGSRGSRDLLVFTDDKEHLLSDDSPVNRLALKPKALAREEIEERGFAPAARIAS
ncbi:MAG TPA: MobF family relaxase [Bryobacteraceae bacterium]|nr:MobF family relaxase [Bryobacteraceae bacterium]